MIVKWHHYLIARIICHSAIPTETVCKVLRHACPHRSTRKIYRQVHNASVGLDRGEAEAWALRGNHANSALAKDMIYRRSLKTALGIAMHEH